MQKWNISRILKLKSRGLSDIMSSSKWSTSEGLEGEGSCMRAAFAELPGVVVVW